ncbi:hypothetical protein [Flavicella sp.]|uniref:hypothetical protein n=1 Tax=Flavicella sp. TaxID=2957742 RepID=UPI00260D2990|nr:hypothetical protein [Flavicella sp.]MDG1803855.1 hypothetical protein [Flavicella sp.]MDG2280961.1 hypothetical protein [Flavicella sp.]
MRQNENVLPNISLAKAKGVDFVDLEKSGGLKLFKRQMKKMGTKVFPATSNQDVMSQVEELFPQAITRYSNLRGTPYFNTVSEKDINALNNVDVLVLNCDNVKAGKTGVWIQDSLVSFKEVLRKSRHLVLVVKKTDLTQDLEKVVKKMTRFFQGSFFQEENRLTDISYSSMTKKHKNLKITTFVV